ncbi:MAG: lipoprotein [Bacteroidales bacterium]
MKKINSGLVLALVAIFMLSGCSGLKKMQKNASDIKYQVKPAVLEMHGGNVNVAIEATYPANFFNKKAVVVATPVLKTAAGEVEYKPLTLQGESVTANNKVINYKTGGKVTYEGTLPYEHSMRVAELYVMAEASMKAKKVKFEPVKLADGIIATPTLLAKEKGQLIVAADKFQRVLSETYGADIMYDINRAEVKKSEMTSTDVAALKNKVKEADALENVKIKGIDVSAYASPDGELSLNDKLARERSKTATAFFKKELQGMKVSQAAQDEFFKLMSTAEDWDGFQDLVSKSNIQDKDLILRVLSMYSDPVIREREIRNISAAFTELADQILPQLRRSKLAVNVDIIGKSDEELLSLATTKPADLNLEEILYAATLTDDLATQNGIYKAATVHFVNCFRAWNNYGMTSALMGDMNTARTAIEKANSLKGNDPVILNNLGVLALAEGNFDKAEGLFRSAGAAGSEVDQNMGVINVQKGNYTQAVSNFGTSCLFNAALAQTLNKDYAKALKTLDCVPGQDPKVDYLRAVVYARQAQAAQMYKSLEDAIGADATLKQTAKTDLEFGKYFEEAKFKALVK